VTAGKKTAFPQAARAFSQARFAVLGSMPGEQHQERTGLLAESARL